jgi:uncharacterized protein YfeS
MVLFSKYRGARGRILPRILGNRTAGCAVAKHEDSEFSPTNGEAPTGKQDHQLKSNPMPKFNRIWDVTPETAHPRARQLLGQSVVWNYGDEDSPLGNDIAADTFAAYLGFRAAYPEGRIQDFVPGQLASRGIPDADWDLLDPIRLEKSLNSGTGFELLRRDDIIIGLAFAQLLLDGAVDPIVRQRAITALRRQTTDIVLSFRGGGGEHARREQLAGFRQVLESV